MLLLGFNIDDDKLPTGNSVEELFGSIEGLLSPKNLENAFTEEEWDELGSTIRTLAGNRPAPRNSVSFQLWKEMEVEFSELKTFYENLLVDIHLLS